MSAPCPRCALLTAAMIRASDILNASFGKGSREVNSAAGEARRTLEAAMRGEQAQAPPRRYRMCLGCTGTGKRANGDDCRSCHGSGTIHEDED